MGTSLQTSSIISIGGLRDSGKTTATDMLVYILNAPKAFRTYKWYKLLRKFPFKKRWETTAFAKPLKETLSIILNKPMSWFESRTNKETYYVDLNTLRIYPRWKLYNDIVLSESKFQKLIKSGEPLPTENLISIRQLMQYYGTEVVRKYLGDKTWINATLNKSHDGKIIVSDLRFKIEHSEIKNRKGTTIYIKRDKAVPGNHSSEKEVVELYNEGKFDYIVENNGSLSDLFNALKKLI